MKDIRGVRVPAPQASPDDDAEAKAPKRKLEAFDALAEPAAAASATLQNLRVRQSYLSADAAQSFSVSGGVVSGTGTANEKHFALLYEALLESPGEPRESVDDPKTKWELVSALGVVLEISVRSLSAEVKFDVFTVAAAVQLGLAEAQFKATVFPSNVPELSSLVLPNGDLTMESYERLMEGIAKVKNALNTPGLQPVPYLRPARVEEPDGGIKLSKTVAFAVQQIADSQFIETALKNAREKRLDTTIVELVYRSMWPGVVAHEDPPDEVIEAAEQWIKEI